MYAWGSTAGFEPRLLALGWTWFRFLPQPKALSNYPAAFSLWQGGTATFRVLCGIDCTTYTTTTNKAQ